MGRPRGRPRKIKPEEAKKVEEDFDDDSEGSPENLNDLPTIEHEITVEQQQIRGAFDSESVRRNQVHAEVVKARRAGKKVKFNGPPEDRYNQCTESYPDRCMVSIERVYPSVVKLRTIQAATVPTFDDLDRYVRQHFWDGQDQGYRFTLKLAGAFQTTGNWSLAQDPMAMEAWVSKLAQAQRTQAEEAYQAANGNRVFTQPRHQQHEEQHQPVVIETDYDEAEEGDMTNGYWVTNGQPGAAPVWVSEKQPPPPGYYPMQQVAPQPPAQPQYAPPPVPQGPPVGARWNGTTWEAPPAPPPVPAPPQAAPVASVDAALLAELKELRQERDKGILDELKTVLKSFANQAQQAQAPSPPPPPQMQQQQMSQPVFMKQVPPGAVWDGEQFVFQVGKQQPQAQAPVQAAAPVEQDPMDAMEKTISFVQKSKKLVNVLSEGYGPKAEAAVEAASNAGGIPMESPMRSLMFEDVGGGFHAAFKKDGDIAMLPSLLPLAPKFLDLVSSGFEKWNSVEAKRTELAIESARRDRAALDRAMQMNESLERRLQANNQVDSENRQHISAPAAPPVQQVSAPTTQPDAQSAHPQQSEPIVAESIDLGGGSEPWDSVPSEDEDPMSGALDVASRRIRSPQPTSEG